MGRKKLFGDNMRERVMVRLPDDTLEVVRSLAAQDECDLGTMIRRLLHKQLDTMGLRALPPAVPQPQRKGRRAA